MRKARLWNLLGTALALTACTSPRPVAPATSFAPTTRPEPPRYVAVHVDHLQPGGLRPFVDARRRWLDVLSQHELSDGRGLFLQAGDSGFLSLRPLATLADLDRQGAAMEEALRGIDAVDRRNYDGASDALLVPPHRNEIWRFDADLSYPVTDPIDAIRHAAWGKMTEEEIDPSPGGEGYGVAWREVSAALSAGSYPLVRVAFWSRYGSGHLVTFWLARSQREFLDTAPVETAVAAVRGQDVADAVFRRLQKAVLASDSIDVIPRPDLSSRVL